MMAEDRNPEIKKAVFKLYREAISIPPIKNQSSKNARLRNRLNELVSLKKRSTAILIHCNWSIFETRPFNWSILETRPFIWSFFLWRDRFRLHLEADKVAHYQWWHLKSCESPRTCWGDAKPSEPNRGRERLPGGALLPSLRSRWAADEGTCLRILSPAPCGWRKAPTCRKNRQKRFGISPSSLSPR